MIDTTNRHRFIYALYAVALLATAAALSLTHHLQTAGLATEANPVTAAVIGDLGWIAAGALGLGTTMLAFAAIFVAETRAPRAALAGAVVTAAVSLLDVANNVYTLATAGALETPGAETVFLTVVLWLVVYRATGAGRWVSFPDVSRPNSRQIRAIVFSAVLVVSIVPGGVAAGEAQTGNQGAYNGIYPSTTFETVTNNTSFTPAESGRVTTNRQNGNIFTGNSTGNGIASHYANGTQRWHKPNALSDNIRTIRYISFADVLIVGDFSGMFATVDPSDGSIINSWSDGGKMRDTAVDYQNERFWISGNNGVFEFNATGGRVGNITPTSYPGGIGYDNATGDLIVSDYSSGDVVRTTTGGSVVWSQSYTNLDSPKAGQAVNGDFYVGGTPVHQIDTSDGSLITTESAMDAAAETIRYSEHSDRLYTVQSSTTGDAFYAFDRSLGLDWSNRGNLQQPYGVAVDHSGENVTVMGADGPNNCGCLQKFETDTTIQRSQTVAGQVTNGDGEPIAGATVQITGVDYDNINPDASQTLEERANELIEESRDPLPDAFDRALEFTGSGSVFDNAGGSDVALAYTREDIAERPWADEAELQPPNTVVPSDEPVVFVSWDPNADPRSITGIPDEYESQLPGGPNGGGTIVVEELGPSGTVVQTQTVDIDQTAGGGFGDPSSLDYGQTRLSPGVYRVSPVGSDVRYTLTVGEPEQLADAIEDDLQTQADQLTTRADEIRENFNQSKFTATTVETNESGYYTAEVGSSVNTVSVAAYKAGSLNINISSSTHPLSQIRQSVDEENYNGSIYIPATPQEYEAPTSNANVTLQEVDNVPYGNNSRYNERLQELLDTIQNQSQRVEDLLQQQNATREELERLYNELENTSSENAELRARMEEILNGEIEIDASSATDSELRQRVAAMQQTLQETRDTMESSTDSTTSQQNVTASARFNQELSADDVTVLAHYSNGTTQTVSAEYITLDDYGTLGGGTEVTVEEYPLGDAATAQFEWVAATDDGHGSARETVRNPVINAEPPEVNSVELTTLSPGPNERVGVELNPASDSDYRELTSATVYAPDGSTVATDNITNGRETSFSTNGAGVHTLQLTYTDVDGNEYTRTVRIEAQQQDEDYRPTVRADSGPSGVYAVVGDGIEDGAVTVTESGDLEVQANVGPDGELPHGELHVDTGTVDTNPSGDISVQLVTGPDNEDIDYRAWVYVHDRSTPADNTYVYRNGRPVTQAGNDQGEVRHNQQQNLYKVYTDETGHVNVEVNQPDGFVAKAYEETKFRVLQISVFGVRMPASLPVGGFGIIGLGLFARRRRRVS